MFFVSIFTGSRDSKINILDKKYKIVNTIDVAKVAFHPIAPKIRSICLNREENKMLVGTFGSEILEISSEAFSIIKVFFV